MRRYPTTALAVGLVFVIAVGGAAGLLRSDRSRPARVPNETASGTTPQAAAEFVSDRRATDQRPWDSPVANQQDADNTVSLAELNLDPGQLQGHAPRTYVYQVLGVTDGTAVWRSVGAARMELVIDGHQAHFRRDAHVSLEAGAIETHQSLLCDLAMPPVARSILFQRKFRDGSVDKRLLLVSGRCATITRRWADENSCELISWPHCLVTELTLTEIVTVLPRQRGLRIELGPVFDDGDLRFEPHASALVCRGRSIVDHPTAPILCARFDRVQGDILRASYHVDSEGVVRRIDFPGGRLEFVEQGQVVLSEGRASGSLLADG